jgi:hypothetical protein
MRISECELRNEFRLGNGRAQQIRPSPIHVNLRGLGLYAEDLTRRDSVKVAQYEVLGNDAKRHVRPGRDDRNVRLLVSHAAQRLPAFGRSSRPGRIPLLRTLTQHFVLGYFREVPAGLIFSNHQPRYRSRPLKLTRMGLRRICFALPLLANGLVMCSGRHNEVAYALPHFNLRCLSILKAWLPPGWGKITNSMLVT